LYTLSTLLSVGRRIKGTARENFQNKSAGGVTSVFKHVIIVGRYS